MATEISSEPYVFANETFDGLWGDPVFERFADWAWTQLSPSDPYAELILTIGDTPDRMMRTAAIELMKNGLPIDEELFMAAYNRVIEVGYFDFWEGMWERMMKKPIEYVKNGGRAAGEAPSPAA